MLSWQSHEVLLRQNENWVCYEWLYTSMKVRVISHSKHLAKISTSCWLLISVPLIYTPTNPPALKNKQIFQSTNLHNKHTCLKSTIHSNQAICTTNTPALKLSLVGAATSIIFVATNTCLLKQNMSFATTKACLLWQTYFCHDKTFVTTNIILSQQNTSFATTKACLLWQTYFAMTKHLSWQT